ncbi:hypothetical protein DFH07DRAFT_823141 [Mycena maculata]|uniref:Uncharacterized protein n=1 Tax=Mycena maculata TaxID=230809 RepID=A0AAD7J4N3_9AGAR|nr:hypothetical protein DFH07DRAFT_823141 [Mycena maculata]
MSSFLKRGRSKLKSRLLQVTHVAASVASGRSASPHVSGASDSRESHTPQPRASEQTRNQTAAELGRTAYDGLSLIVQSLYDCSDIFLPLKTAAGVFLAITGVVEKVSANKKELDELELRLKSILSIHQGNPPLVISPNYRKFDENLTELPRITSVSYITNFTQVPKNSGELPPDYHQITGPLPPISESFWGRILLNSDSNWNKIIFNVY